MTSLRRIELSVAFVSALVILASGDRLSLNDGGYARVVSLQPYPLTSFTLSGWVNVTRFPEGIAPVLTYLSQDVNSQLSFFLRPEGIGILWGGPTGAPHEEEPLMNRRPRLHDGEKDKPKREKREAVDYSGGLGDIENILSKRSGPAQNTWGPSNFVDVGMMGVDDLMLSGSDQFHSVSADMATHVAPPVYSDWTNVPYELHMAESGMDEDYADHEDYHQPSIITKPSGDDDFVYFNWNVPADGSSQREIPLGNNNWSPVWESTKQNLVPTERTPLKKQQKPTKPIGTSLNVNQVWTDGVDKGVDLTNKWDPVGLEEEIYDYPLETKLLPTKVERPVWPSNQKQRPKPARPTTTKSPRVQSQQPNIATQHRAQTYYQSNNIRTPPSNNGGVIRLKGIQIAGTPAPETAPVFTTTTEKPTTEEVATTRKTSLNSRRNSIPPLYRYKKRKNVSTTPKPQVLKETTQASKPSRSRIPLWKFLNKPSKEDQEPFISTTERIEKKQTTETRYSIPMYTKPSFYTSTIDPPLVKKIQYSIPEPTLPPIKKSGKDESPKPLGSPSRNVFYRSRPVQSPSIARRPSTIYTTTTSPSTTPRRISYRPTTITHRVPNYHASKVETQTSKSNFSPLENTDNSNLAHKFKVNSNIAPKLNAKLPTSKPNRPKPSSSKYGYTRANEFEKVMQDPKMVKEGNTAVIYAVPITNEKEFYEMYKKYQEESMAPSKSALNLHELYNEMRTGAIDDEKEEEISGNGLKSPEISLYNDKFYVAKSQDALGPQNISKPKPSTTTTEKIIIEEKTTSTSPRSDIPIDYEEEMEDKVPAETNGNREIEVEESQIEQFYPEYEDDEFSDFLSDNFYDYYNSNTYQEPDEPISSPLQDSDYFIPTDEGFSAQLANLYKPKNVETVVTPEPSPSFYQEPQKLFHEQLPPQYEKPDKSYDFSAANKVKVIPNHRHQSEPNHPIHNRKIVTPSYKVPQEVLQKQTPVQHHIVEEPDFDDFDPIPDNMGSDTIPSYTITKLDTSYYQQPPKPAHIPLPANYDKPEKQYDFNIGNLKESQDNQYQPDTGEEKYFDNIYSSNPEDLIAQGLIPQAIHMVGTQEEANTWMKNQEPEDQEQGYAQSSFNFPGMIQQPSVGLPPHLQQPAFPHPKPPPPPPPFSGILPGQSLNDISAEKMPLNIHFEKVSYPFTENTWYHLTFTWNIQTRRATLYVNGEHVGTLQNVLDGEPHLEGGGLFLLGKTLLPDLSDFDESSQFEGEMSDVNLWATELPPPSVDAMFQCKYDPVSPQPLDWETTPLKLYDQSNLTPSPPLCGLIT